MFAVVRTGGKQYRVAAGDKIAVEKIPGEAGDSVTLSDVLLSGEGGNVKAAGGITVAAEIVAQAKGDKVVVFKKRRRHNYRRKKGHRQQYTILMITAIGDQKAEKAPKKASAAKVDTGKADTAKADTAKAEKAGNAPKPQDAPLKIEGAEGPIDAPAKAKAKKETAKTDAAPAKPAKSEPTAGETDSPKKKSTKKAKSDTDTAEG